LPRQPDNPEANSSVSHPELNPLLNPVLGDHMGQWAEVYFTSPPEKREEAVLQLLRELGGDARLRNAENGSAAEIRGSESDTCATYQLSQVVDEQNIPLEVTCGACGAQNPRQSYCGMCGAEIEQRHTLEGYAEPPGSPIIAEEIDSREGDNRDFQGWRAADSNGGFLRGDEEYLSEREAGTYDAPRLIPEYEPIPYRYRMYVGIALAILVAGLVYVAWQGTHAVPGSSRTLPPAAPAPAKTAQPQPAPAARADTPDKKRTPNPDRSDEASTPSDTAKADVNSHPTAPAAAPVAKTSGAANTTNPAAPPPSQVSTAKGNGSEELAIAESYLNGTHGRASDNAEAAKWLWKSVAKQNSSAALMLSDLYLKGNGVAKNCDQARLLLDIATRKGAAGAANRLRNLQAFGCQ
jgi:hypothetical protein